MAFTCGENLALCMRKLPG